MKKLCMGEPWVELWNDHGDVAISIADDGGASVRAIGAFSVVVSSGLALRHFPDMLPPL